MWKSKKVADEFLFYLEVERISPHTLRSYSYDLHLFSLFLQQIHQTDELDYVQNSTAARVGGSLHAACFP